MGTIGAINAEFTASTSNFSASLKDVGAMLDATAAKATAAGQKADSGIRMMTTAAERARKAWQRELVAQDRAAEGAAEVARANELAALKSDILARSNDELALSSNRVVAGFQRMSRGVNESLDKMGEKMTAVAEKAELSADGIAAGFGGLGKLLGVGLAGDFLAHMLDNLAELNVRLGDLHEKTGISVQDLSGLRMVALAKGLDFTTISMGLIRMSKAMYEAKQGMVEDREAFSSLGISMHEVDTLSPEQMFFRLSKAMAENRSLVVADGTALEIFGRGGKELVPMLRQWGGGLEAMAKQQGALTGITEDSVAASQQWLQATVALSAEFHATMIPVLQDLVKSIPYVTAGFDLLEVGVEKTFGTIINSAATVADSIMDIYKAQVDIFNFKPPSQVWNDIRSIWTANKSGWTAQKKYEDTAALGAAAAMAGRGGGLLPGAENIGRNQPGGADGALMKSARQQLATMEQKHPLSHGQLIDFWKSELGKAKKGSVDYDQVNLVLGNLMQHPGHRAKGDDSDPRMSQKEWQESIGKNTGARRFLTDYYKKRPLAPLDLLAQVSAKSKSGDAQQMAADASIAAGWANPVTDPRLTAQLQKLQARHGDIDIANRHHLQRAQLQEQVRGGTISPHAAALQKATLDAQEFGEQMDELTKKLKKIADPMNGLTDQQRGVQRQQVYNEQAKVQGSYAVTSVQNASAIQRTTGFGGVNDALMKFAQRVTDASQVMGDFTMRMLGGLNQAIVGASMGQKGTFRQFGKSFEASGMNTMLQGAEGYGIKGVNSLLGSHFTNGKLGTASNPMYVKLADKVAAAGKSLIGDVPAAFHHLFGGGGGSAAAAKSPTSRISAALSGAGSLNTSISSVSALLPYTSGFDSGSGSGSDTTGTKRGGMNTSFLSGLGSMAGLMKSALSIGSILGFADGGVPPTNRPSIVGERGPELFLPGTSGRILPNGALGGSTTHIHIDARGTNAAMVQSAVARGMRASYTGAVHTSSAQAADRARRRP